jgi:hypothetical protein
MVFIVVLDKVKGLAEKASDSGTAGLGRADGKDCFVDLILTGN